MLEEGLGGKGKGEGDGKAKDSEGADGKNA